MKKTITIHKNIEQESAVACFISAKVWTPCNFSSKTLQTLLKVCIFAVPLSKYQFTKNYTRTAAVYEKGVY